MAHRHEIDTYLRQLLDVDRFKDYGPNGLQVEGRTQVQHVLCGVTASLALIEAAITFNADAVIVHHGLFWRGQDGRLTGWLRERVARLIAANINLFAFHLPLDAHGDLGNNAQLGLRLGMRHDATFGDQGLGFTGSLTEPSSVLALMTRIESSLGRKPTVVEGDGRPLRRLAWCTGGAQGYFEDAIAAGADAYLTGEISEPQAHLARETGVAYFACGHHATERYGVQALTENVSAQFGLTHQFVDIENPA